MRRRRADRTQPHATNYTKWRAVYLDCMAERSSAQPGRSLIPGCRTIRVNAATRIEFDGARYIPQSSAWCGREDFGRRKNYRIVSACRRLIRGGLAFGGAAA